MCHEKNLVHGLLKPANLMVKADHTILILDMGMGTLLGQEESVIHTGGLANLAASADYSAPETAIDPTSGGPAGDQYSLGCILYFCLTGQQPFEGDNYVTKMMAHQTKQPPPVKEKAPDAPDGLIEVMQKMMAKKPSDRYESMFHMVAAIRPFMKTETTPAFDSRAMAGAKSDAARPKPPAEKPAAARSAPPPAEAKPAAPQAEVAPVLRPPWAEPSAEPKTADGVPTRQTVQAPVGSFANAMIRLLIFAVAGLLVGGILTLLMNLMK